jgi:hypothetical protein
MEILDAIWEGRIMADHVNEVEKDDLDDNRSLKTRMSNKKSPDFSSSTLRRLAFMEHSRSRLK